jgi:hypothetical protein
MVSLGRSLGCGAAGAVALTALHEFARRRIAAAPRMDVVAKRGLRQLLPWRRPDEVRLHRMALAGDLVSNSLYYAAIPASTPAATWGRAILLGTVAGLGAIVLPARMGLGTPPHAESLANRLMTVGWYLTGAATTALIATTTTRPRYT